ncbi:membrane protein [Burkholderia pseudomallei 1710b]|uniref:Membrane protein n=29 Tax=Burkholderia TaxID=32008 RepID=Q3JLW4_BURP1|nr:membrane protein [Burkholderia pseudomallei 1710b]
MRAQTANRGPPPHKTDDRRPRVALSWRHFSTSIRAARAMPMSARTNAAFTALLAAALFGATTPLAKTLLGSLTPFMVAGLFYLGSGVGLGAFMLMRRLARGAGAGASPAGHARLPLAELPWLAGAVAAGGVAGPALLMLGLATTPAATSALLLNLEGVFTALIAWAVFRENVDAQIFAGMAAIVAGGVLLSWHPGAAGVPLGALLVAAACACWAIDNNLTRKVSTHDAAAIACVKGLVAGTVNLGIALALGARLPAAADSAAAMLTGFAGYGVSLVLFVVALRNLGTARTGAYFSVAPLFGVGLSLALWPEWPPLSFWAAAALMALGIWLHLRERHEHPHTHEALEHSHRHRHDTHHQHAHDFDWDGTEPHTHAHRHTPITHTHAHFPDIHHRHSH